MGKLSGRRCIPTPVDARKPTQLRESVEKTIASFGRIDFVVCGASDSDFLGNVLSQQFEFDPRGHWQLPPEYWFTIGQWRPCPLRSAAFFGLHRGLVRALQGTDTSIMDDCETLVHALMSGEDEMTRTQ